MKKNHPIVPLLIGLAVLTAGPLLLAQPPERPPSPAGVTACIQHHVQDRIQLTGTVRPGNETRIAAEVSGRIAKVKVKPGQAFQKGDILLELDRTLLGYQRAAAKSSMAEARANWELATIQQERSANMFSKALISTDEKDTYHQTEVAAEARFHQEEARFDQLNYQYEQALVKAPYDGVMLDQLAFTGDWVQSGEDVAKCISTENDEVWVELPEKFFSNRLKGQSVDIVFPHEKGKIHKASIRALVPKSDPKSHTFPIILEMPYRHDFGFGMMVHTSIPYGETRQVLMVPKDAISYNGDQASVWIVNEDNSIHNLQIQTGTAAGAWMEVRGDIHPGSRVITRGNERLYPGMSVAPESVEYELP